MFDAGNLAVLGIAVFLMLVLRYIDRNRLQLTKIRKFAERQGDELVRLAEEKKRGLKDATIELDLLFKRARHAEQAAGRVLATLDARLEGLGLKAQDLAEVEGKLGAVSAVLKETRQLSAAVEREAPAVRKAATALEAMRAELADVAERVPALERDYRARAEETLSGFFKGLQEMKLAEMDRAVAEGLGVVEARVVEVERFSRDFTAESGLLRKAEKQLAGLQAEIAAVAERMQSVREEKAEITALRQEMASFRKEEQAVRVVCENIKASRQELGAVEGRLATVGAAMTRFEKELVASQEDFRGEVERQRAEIRAEVDSFAAELDAVKEKAARATREELAELEGKAKEIDLRLKSFAKETRVFERADKLSERLGAELSDLNTRMEQLKNEKKDLVALRREVGEIKREEEAARELLAAIARDREELERIDGKVNRLAESTGKLETRFEAVGQAGNLLKPVEARIHEIEKLGEQLKKEMDEVSLKDAKLAHAFTAFRKAETFVDKLEGKLETLKTGFTAIETEKQVISRQVDGLTTQSRKLAENEARIGRLLSQFDQMGGMLIDVEKRIGQVTLAQDKLLKMESRLRDLSGQAESRIEELTGLERKMDVFFGVEGAAPRSARAASRQDREPELLPVGVPSPRMAAGAASERKLNDQIFKMHDAGMDIPQIAKIVKRPISDVELRLHVRKD